MLRRHLEHALQRLLCPQSVQHGWKGMVIARELYSLLTNVPFRLPTNPGKAAIYVCAVVAGQPVNNAPLLRTEQASIDTLFIATSTTLSRCRTSIARALRPSTQASTMPSKYRTIQTFEDGSD